MFFTPIYAVDYELTLQKIALWPLILLVAGVVIWMVAWRNEKEGTSPKIKWIAMIPLAVAVFLSYGTFFTLIDSGIDGEMQRDAIDNSRRLTYAAYFAFLAPALCILGFTVWSFIDKKMSKYR